MDLQNYLAQLTPAQVQQEALEKRQRIAKRKAIRKKRVRRGVRGWRGAGQSVSLKLKIESVFQIVCFCAKRLIF